MPFQTFCITDTLGSLLRGNEHKCVDFTWISAEITKRQDSMVFAYFSVFLLTFLPRAELVGLTVPGQDVGILYGHYNHLAMKGLSLRSSCLSSSTDLKVWNQIQLTDLFSKLKIQTLLVLTVECPVFGP